MRQGAEAGSPGAGAAGAQTAAALKVRAVRLLARREYSRADLARKLAPHAESAEQVQALLDELVAARLVSNERFAESLVHRRAGRYGTVTIGHELRTHGLDEELVRDHLAALERTELERVRAVWARRFGRKPESPAERARQLRFLLARGFTAATVYRVLGARLDDEG